jgi:superfamily II DNA or RNA helicase
MTKITNFSSFPDTVGVVQDNGIEIIITSKHAEAIKKHLTADNKTASYQIQRLEKQRSWTPEAEEQRLADLETFRADLEREYFAELPNGSLSVPIGFWYLCSKIDGILNTEISSNDLPTYLRDYQKEDITTLLKYKRALLCLATGCGKTCCALAITTQSIKANKRTCMIVPTIDLVSQTIASAKQFGIPNVSGAGGTYQYQPGCDLLVTTVQSAYKYIDVFDTVVVDECVPFSAYVITELGPLKIGNLWRTFFNKQPLPKVRTLNERTNQWEFKNIVRVIRSEPRPELIEFVAYSGYYSKQIIRCTDDHPILTVRHGWIKAKDLTYNQRIVGWKSKEPMPVEYRVKMITRVKNIQPLFDLEVEDNHNFLASYYKEMRSSILVHNCHHSSATTWFNLLASATKATNIYGLSATPYRTDGLDIGISAWIGPVVVERSAKWGIENGWLAEPKIFMIKISGLPFVSSKKMGAIAYGILAKEEKVQKFLLGKIQQALAAGRTVMVIFNTVKAGEAFKQYCIGKLDFDVAHAGYRVPFIKFKKGETDLLVGNVKLFGEGVDVPRVSCIITLCNNSSEITTRQVIGRAMRISKGKKDAIVLDIGFDSYEPYEKAYKNRSKIYKTIADNVKEILV